MKTVDAIARPRSQHLPQHLPCNGNGLETFTTIRILVLKACVCEMHDIDKSRITCI